MFAIARFFTPEERARALDCIPEDEPVTSLCRAAGLDCSGDDPQGVAYALLAAGRIEPEQLRGVMTSAGALTARWYDGTLDPTSAISRRRAGRPHKTEDPTWLPRMRALCDTARALVDKEGGRGLHRR